MRNTTRKELNSPGKNNTGRLNNISQTPEWSRIFNRDFLFFRAGFKKRF